MVATQSARLGQITEAVLLATQLDRGTLAVEPEAVDVGELTRSTVEAMRSQLPASAEVDLEIAPQVGTASGAPDRIQQVLVNLLDNAVKYGGDGTVNVRVEPANGVVRILVADSGPASRSLSSSGSSRSSTAPGPSSPARPAAPGSASTSRASSCSGWAAGSRFARSRAPARRSSSSCRARTSSCTGSCRRNVSRRSRHLSSER